MEGVLFPSGIPVAPEGGEGFQPYIERGGYAGLKMAVARLTPQAVVDMVVASGLRGRGGAGFPTGQKWTYACQSAQTGQPPYLVCNGGEDEPGSIKDRLLLERYPHLVLEGVALAAYAICASTAYLYVNQTFQEAIHHLQGAIAEASAANLIGKGILGSAFTLEVKIHPAPTNYVAGEDTAALEVLEGRQPLPRPKPPYPTTAGLFGKPTVVNNVETLANLPSMVSRGVEWYCRFGTKESTGTMLFTLGEEVERPGVYELPFGTSLRQLIDGCGGGLKGGKRLKAILPGGPSTAFLLPQQIDIPLDHNSLREAGSALGCGVVRLIPEGSCMVEEGLRIAEFFGRESCGQCPACRMETGMLVGLLQKVQQGQGGEAMLAQIPAILNFNRGRGYCNLINMPGPPLESALRLFPADFDHHLRHGSCPAMA